MRQISQLIAMSLDQDGHRRSAITKEFMAELYEQLWREFRASDIGRKLIARGGPDIMDRVLAIYGDRSRVNHPGVCPVFEMLEEIGNDLLMELGSVPAQVAVPKPAPKAIVVPTAVQKEQQRLREEAREKHENRVRQFVHMVDRQLSRDGVQSLKPRAGVVLVIAESGNRYAYPHNEFESLWADATKMGLLTTGGLR